MKQHIIDYLKQFDHTLVSPVWGGKKEFSFTCMGHLEMANSLGFELVQVTPVLYEVKPGQLTTEEQLEQILKERKIDDSHLKHELQMLKWIKEVEPDSLKGGGCFGPLTVTSDILGVENLLKMIVKKPEFVEKVVAYVNEFIIEIAKRESREGMDLFWIAEPLASLVSPKNFWRFSGQYLKKAFEAAGVPGFLHVCGKTIKHTPYMVDTGAEVLSIDSCTDIGECIRMVDEDVVIMGNVDTSTLRFGSRQDVEREVKEILDACKGFPNFILSTGCIIMDETPYENMMVLFEMCEL